MPPLAFGQSPGEQFSQCLNSCFSVCDTGPERLAWGCRENCGTRCEGVNQNPPGPYGAIAYGTDHGAEGISWNKGTQAEADQTALASCRKYGNNCRIVYRYQNTCAALAVAKGALHSEAATGDTEKNAAAKATAVCQRNWGQCLADLSACSLTGETRPSPPPAPRGTSWGAIAYSSRDMGAGWSQGKNDRATAEKEAMQACSERGKDCVLQTVFNKQCGALAADRTVTGCGTSTDPRQAQQQAIAACQKAGGARCELHIFLCSF